MSIVKISGAVIFKDIPPFVHYLLGLVLAFGLLRGY